MHRRKMLVGERNQEVRSIQQMLSGIADQCSKGRCLDRGNGERPRCIQENAFD